MVPFEVATFSTTQQRANVKRNSATKAGFQPARMMAGRRPASSTCRRSPRRQRGRDLGDPVRTTSFVSALPADPDSERDRRVGGRPRCGRRRRP